MYLNWDENWKLKGSKIYVAHRANEIVSRVEKSSITLCGAWRKGKDSVLFDWCGVGKTVRQEIMLYICEYNSKKAKIKSAGA